MKIAWMRILIAVLVLAVPLSLAACGTGDVEGDGEPTPVEQTADAGAAEPEDGDTLGEANEGVKDGLVSGEAIGDAFPSKIPLPAGEVLTYQVLDDEPGVVMHNLVIGLSESGVAEWYYEEVQRAGFKITDVSPSKENIAFSDGTIEGYTDITEEAFALSARVPE